MSDHTWWETVELKGEQLLDAVRAVVAEGNVRRVRVRQGQRTIAEFPLTVGVVGAVLAPVLAAIGAIAALIAECSIDIERTDRPASGEGSASGSAADKT